MMVTESCVISSFAGMVKRKAAPTSVRVELTLCVIGGMKIFPLPLTNIAAITS